MPGGMTPEQVERLIPKDCLIFNWFWSDEPGEHGGNAELNEATLDKMGFQQVYGNFEPDYRIMRRGKSALRCWVGLRRPGLPPTKLVLARI